MGILNLTPDSFYDGGKYKSDADILVQVEKMINEGVGIIDIGAVSTRPGAKEISDKDELHKLLPAFKKIITAFPEIIISIDTYRSEVARKLIDAGAHIINDISGGTFDHKMFDLVAKTKVAYILMHIKGTPENMQNNPVYQNVTLEVMDFFRNQLSKLAKLEVKDNLVLDPGFGFGKTLSNNYQLLKDLDQFKQLGHPVLAGVSRKSMINKVLGTIPESALNGTTALHTIALLNGANILRVHDAKEAKEVVKLVDVYRKQ